MRKVDRARSSSCTHFSVLRSSRHADAEVAHLEMIVKLSRRLTDDSFPFDHAYWDAQIASITTSFFLVPSQIDRLALVKDAFNRLKDQFSRR